MEKLADGVVEAEDVVWEVLEFGQELGRHDEHLGACDACQKGLAKYESATRRHTSSCQDGKDAVLELGGG